MEYKKVNDQLEVKETKEIIQSFTLEQIDEMIVNTQKQKQLKESELIFINNALVELTALKNKATQLGVVAQKVEVVESEVLENLIEHKC